MGQFRYINKRKRFCYPKRDKCAYGQSLVPNHLRDVRPFPQSLPNLHIQSTLEELPKHSLEMGVLLVRGLNNVTRTAKNESKRAMCKQAYDEITFYSGLSTRKVWASASSDFHGRPVTLAWISWTPRGRLALNPQLKRSSVCGTGLSTSYP